MAFEKIKRILCNDFEIDEIDITLDAAFLDDLGIDSIDMADLVMSFEDEFEMELPDEDLERIKTVGDLVRFAEEN